MLKLISFFVLLFAAASVLAGNVPYMSGPFDPGNALGSINTWISGSLNPSTPGNAAMLPAPVTTGGTAIETDMQYTIPAGALRTGDSFTIVVEGVNSADANAKTLTFSFGGQTCALTVTGSGAQWQATFNVDEDGSKTQVSECHGQQGTASLAPVAATNWTVDNTAAIAVLIRQTAATSGTMTLNRALMFYRR